jgi:hypothetical protein
MPSQSNWRFCTKCNALYFNGFAGGRCPAGGAHARQAAADYDFVLPFAGYGAGISPDVAAAPAGKYVDLFTECVYDINYNVTNYFSSVLQLKYFDGLALELDIEKDLQDISQTPEAARDAMARGYIGRAGRIFPTALTPRTVPRLFAARAEALAAQDEAFRDFANLAIAGVVFALTVPAMPAGMAAGAGGAGGAGRVTRSMRASSSLGRTVSRPIPFGQTGESLGTAIGARAAEGAKTASQLGEAGPSWINRIIMATRRLRLKPSDSAEVIESATKAAKYGHGPRTVLSDGTIVVTSARTGPNNFVVGIRSDGMIARGMGTVEMGPAVPNGVRVTEIVWQAFE